VDLLRLPSGAVPGPCGIAAVTTRRRVFYRAS